MKIYSLYQDFFSLLDNTSPDSSTWDAYSTHYFKPNREFLETVFSHFPLVDESNLKERVEAIKATDYAWLKHLISLTSPEKTIENAYERCAYIISAPEEPEVYLFIGFFSPDGFVMDFQGKPVLCFGLERFSEFKLLGIIFAHEYAHFLLRMSKGDIPEEEKGKWFLISEGLATYFTSLAFPEMRKEQHFLLGKYTLAWCQQNESSLRKEYSSKVSSQQTTAELYAKGNPALSIPPRAGKYLGYLAVQRFLDENADIDITTLFANKKLALSLEL